MSIKNRIWLHTTNGVILDTEKADFQIPTIKEVYKWINNTEGDIHIFENQKVLDHDKFEGFKIAYVRESPTIYDYTSQFGTPHIHKWVIENKKYFNHFFSCFNYLKEHVGTDKFTYVPVGGSRIKLTEYGLYEKERNISIVASFKDWTYGHRLRHKVIESTDRTQLEVYGSGYNEIIDQYDDKFGKIIAIAPYRYSFAIMNSDQDDYFTDIIIDCLAVGTIPIFWGTGNISKYFNIDGIVQFKDISEVNQIIKNCTEDYYISKLPAIKENIEIAKKYSSTYDWMYNNINFDNIVS